MKKISRLISIDFQRQLNRTDMDKIKLKLSKTKGINWYNITRDTLMIWYSPYIINEDSIKKLLIELGIQ